MAMQQCIEHARAVQRLQQERARQQCIEHARAVQGLQQQRLQQESTPLVRCLTVTSQRAGVLDAP
jgi:hypothetical protein